MLGINANIINQDIFGYKGNKFDRIFNNCPFGMRYANLEMSSNLEKVSNRIEGFKKGSSAEWAFCVNALLNLKQDGRVVSVLSYGSLVNRPDAELRKNLLSEHVIETIIALPERLFSGTSIKTYLVVFSHNNTSINMIDASNLFTAGRRINTIDNADIKRILDVVGTESEISKVVSYDEIETETFSLDPLRYTTKEELFDNDKELGAFLKSIRRASRVSADELDELVTNGETNNKIITMGDIQDSTLSISLKSLIEFPEKSEKFIVNKNDILISRSANPEFKVAIYDGNEDCKAIAVGNLYAITVDENVLDSYYLLAFLNSKLGQARLSANSSGSTLRVLPVEGINNVKIPMVSIEGQKEIASKAEKLTSEIKNLKAKLNDYIDALSDLF
jgi:type I restriction-modification system DNA methylase subunit